MLLGVGKFDKWHRQLIGVWLFVGVTATVVILRRNSVGLGEVGAKKADIIPLLVPTDIETLQNQAMRHNLKHRTRLK